ncbi:MAG: hypothetical protein WCK60_02145 [Candidatus Nomurabacteria bacterium]
MRTIAKNIVVGLFLMYLFFNATLGMWVMELLQKKTPSITVDQLKMAVWATITIGVMLFIVMMVAWLYKWPSTVSWFHIAQGLIGLGGAISASWILMLMYYGESSGILSVSGAIIYTIGVICMGLWVINPKRQPEPTPKPKKKIRR